MEYMRSFTITFIAVLSLFMFISCEGKTDGSATGNVSDNGKNEKKSKDQEMEDKLVGSYFMDDETKDNITVSDYSIEFFKDRKIQCKFTRTEYDPDLEIYDTREFDIMGTWKIENGFLKSVVESATTDPESTKDEIKEFISRLNKNNTADKIIEINDQKYVYDDADGERKTLKRKVE